MPKNYFVCANSAEGFKNFFPSVLKEMEKVYIIKGGPGTGKSTMMKKIGKHFEDKGSEVEYIYCSSDYNSLDGVVIKDIKTAVVDGTAPHVIEPTAPGAIEEYLSFSDTWDSEKLAKNKNEILSLNSRISDCYTELYKCLETAKEYHDKLEEIYIKNTDFHKLENLADILIEEVFRESLQKDTGTRTHRFLGAMTWEGSVNYIENLTEGMKTRYFIKGRAGTGKSTFLKKLIKAAEERKIDAEVYHCSFDPNSIDMVIFPSLGISIFDSTAPHELFPSNENDIILDFYETAVKSGTDEIYSEDIYKNVSEYNGYINEARNCLKKAHELHDELEEIYIAAVDFDAINHITNATIKKIDTIK